MPAGVRDLARANLGVVPRGHLTELRPGSWGPAVGTWFEMTGPVGDGSAAHLRRAKASVTAAFMAHAVLFSSWAAHIPHVKAALGLSDGALGTALFGAPLGCVAATVLSHWTLPRWGSRRLVTVTVAGYAVSGVTIGLAG